MNRMSVVLAADSASTITYYENGERVQRYFKGANKVFQLSGTHPVGLMIYGNAEIQGVPWELVIKAFRKQLGASSFDSVEGYAQAFGHFLNDNQQLFPEQLRNDNFQNSVELDTMIACRDFNRMQQDGDFDEAAHLETLKKMIGEKAFENGLDEKFEKELLERWNPVILQLLRESEDTHVSNLVGDRTDQRLLDVISLTVSLKAKSPPNSATGLVFAGFGDQSVYPEAYAVADAGFVANRLALGSPDSIIISQNFNSYISGFAQSSMADTFIIGFDEQVFATISEVQEQTFPEGLVRFAEALGGSVEMVEGKAIIRDGTGDIVVDEQVFASWMQEFCKNVRSKIMDESRQKHGEPLERVISMLPVEEMAELAATMVDLQSLKEKVTRPSETVGGPVDVAIITKNEGLVWKKRKHFFDSSINQRYLQRLQTQD